MTILAKSDNRNTNRSRKSLDNKVNTLSSILKSIRDIMRRDKGLNGELDRLPQLTWIMLLKFLDDVEIRDRTHMQNIQSAPLIDPPYRWRDWASNFGGLTGEELISFINDKESLRPDGTNGPGLREYLLSLRSSDNNARSIVSNVFKGIENKMTNGYLLKDVINKVNEFNFSSTTDIHVLGHLYESLLKELRDAAGDSGEFYTPRPITKFMVQVINPKLGESILDPAAGTGGFLVEAFHYLKSKYKREEDYETLQKKTFFGIEPKSLPYLICQMNLLLNGLHYPNIDSQNALRVPLNKISENEKVDIILTNPPFGGEEESSILTNFPLDKRTTNTSLLFLQLVMAKIREPKDTQIGGRCGIVLPNGFLFGGGIALTIRKELIEKFNLHTIIRLPKGTFSPYTDIATNLLFFNKQYPTKEIWFYELSSPEGKQYTRTRPLTYKEFEPIINWWKNRKESVYSWKVSVNDLKNQNYNLDLQNPNTIRTHEYSSVEDLMNDILEKEEKIISTLKNLKKVIRSKDKCGN